MSKQVSVISKSIEEMDEVYTKITLQTLCSSIINFFFSKFLDMYFYNAIDIIFLLLRKGEKPQFYKICSAVNLTRKSINGGGYCRR